MMDDALQEAGAHAVNPDVSAFAKRMRTRYQAREQKKAMLINPVKQASVPPNEIRRGFTYFEQSLTDTSLTDSLTDLINQKMSSPEKPYPIYGIVDGSMIRWSGDVPNHSFLLVNHPDQPSPDEYKGVHIDVHFPSDYPDQKGFNVVVSGSQIDRSDIDRAAKYLSQNIKGHDDVMMKVYVLEDEGDIFKGALKEYRQQR